MEVNKLTADIKHYISLINFDNPKELSDGASAIRLAHLKWQIPHDLLTDIHGFCI